MKKRIKTNSEKVVLQHNPLLHRPSVFSAERKLLDKQFSVSTVCDSCSAWVQVPRRSRAQCLHHLPPAVAYPSTIDNLCPLLRVVFPCSLKHLLSLAQFSKRGPRVKRFAHFSLSLSLIFFFFFFFFFTSCCLEFRSRELLRDGGKNCWSERSEFRRARVPLWPRLDPLITACVPSDLQTKSACR